MRPLDYDQLEQLAKIVTDTPEDAVYLVNQLRGLVFAHFPSQIPYLL
ncbi:hypothetical protein [Paenibacillus brasilensis]|uniref:Uncharacterized protein n=1 Tax=Paenibacillus brasilensis TaxID=128574 RepID=A0ABU0KT60_9BACL|nr:hypothetical protein [Paenibacillus brasilensis]MDQ0492555.1 hypothetical protein [Paenibacillus brasilensis]